MRVFLRADQLTQPSCAGPGLRAICALVLLCGTGLGFGAQPQAELVDATSQQKVWQLLQRVIQEHWNGGELKTSSATNASSTNVEAAFREASQLMPARLDLRFGVASCLVGEALQTNGLPLETKVRDALAVYREIELFDTNGFDAPLLSAAYARSIGLSNVCDAMIQRLAGTFPERAREYVQKFHAIDLVLAITPSEAVSSLLPVGANHAIVVLGAGLETNGTMKAKLASRLGQCLKLARLCPNSPIILTGGNSKGGVTEAYIMSRWCTQRGISRKRLILEDKAKDTIENALFSTAILQRLGATNVTLVTSASHVRRALADFEEACRQRGLAIRFGHLAARTKGDVELDPEQERVGIYRDVLRASGLWAFPGMQR